MIEGLREFEQATGGTPESRAARTSGEEYLLERSLFRRLSTGEPADKEFLSFVHPSRWRYDVLRALACFRSAATLPGRVWFEIDSGAGQPSRWVTLRAMRVLRWWQR